MKIVQGRYLCKTITPIAPASWHIRLELLNPKARTEVISLFGQRNAIIEKELLSDNDKAEFWRLNRQICGYIHPDIRRMLDAGVEPPPLVTAL